jgi:hypothetical protein
MTGVAIAMQVLSNGESHYVGLFLVISLVIPGSIGRYGHEPILDIRGHPIPDRAAPNGIICALASGRPGH